MKLINLRIKVDTKSNHKCDNCVYNITEQQRYSPLLNLLGVNVDNTTVQEVLEWINLQIEQDQHRLIFFVNPACLNIASQDVEYLNALKNADRILPDGIGLKIGCWLLNQKLRTNLNGTDLFPDICKEAAKNGNSIFLLGGEPTVAHRAALAMKERYPELIIAGTRHGFFTSDQEGAVIDMINESRPAILLVGLGVPKQELWLVKVRPLLSANICMAVGGLFDYYSGRIPRAPKWMRDKGLEWCWRLYQEPIRLWRRYLIGNPMFIKRMIQQRMTYSKFYNYDVSICSPHIEQIKLGFVKLYKKAISIPPSSIKRGMDVTISLTLLIILLPLFLLVSILIYQDSPGPILYKQTRVGKLGELFTMWKFRSMGINADNQLKEVECDNETKCGILFKIRNDPRITKIGRIIRKTSIDELPQLWNVLKGEMSLVGPRPALLTEVQRYSVNDKRRLEVKPGITCIWQVSGRSNIPFNEQVMMDIQYIDSHSIWLDIKLLLLTIPAVLTGHGAY